MDEDPERPNWFEAEWGGFFCAPCRKDMLRDWSPTAVRNMGGNEDEVIRASDFTNVGRTPWAGAEPGDRYVQCDGCNGQWGPDAY